MTEKAPPKTLAERTRTFRERKREREGIAAVAVARLVTGRDPGDGARVLAKWLRDTAVKDGFDDDRADLVDEAARLLERRRRV